MAISVEVSYWPIIADFYTHRTIKFARRSPSEFIKFGSNTGRQSS